MENPAKQTVRALLFVALGITIGFVPGAIRVDQLRREVTAATTDAAKQIAELKQSILERDDLSRSQTRAQESECSRVILGDGSRTILVDQNHPYGGYTQNILGVSLVIPPPVSRVAISPVWIVPRSITPAVVDGVMGGVYTHIWPDGRTDGWHQAEGPR